MTNLNMAFILIMVCVVAFLFVDITGGKKVTKKSLKIYSTVFTLAGLAALVTYMMSH